MRLLFVTQDFPPDVGGIQTYSKELAPRLAARCERFLLLAPSRPGDDEVDASIDASIQRLPVRSEDLLVLRAFPRILGLIRRERFDVALHVQWQTAFASLLARTLTKAPLRVAVTLHGKDTVFNPFSVAPLRWGYDALRRMAVTRADHVLPVSRFLGRRAQELGADEEDVTVVHNATNPEIFYPDPSPDLRDRLEAGDRPIVLSAGRLVPKKGFDTAIRAIASVKEEIPDVLLLIAGEGPQRAALERLVETLGLDAHVRFVGSVSQQELRHYYSVADIFLMAGRQTSGDVEGFGLVYLEANACGTPVVGARVGGVPDAVWHEETGLLVPPDSPDATADALLRLLTSPDFARQLGEQGRERVRTEANWDHVADRIYALLNRSSA